MAVAETMSDAEEVPSRAKQRRSRPSRFTVSAWLVIVLFCAWSLVVAARTSAGFIPQSDDWAYIKSALFLHDHGELQLQNFGQMFLLGQLITAQPFLWIFGARAFSLDIYGAICTAIFLGCVFSISRRCVGERRAFLLLLCVLLWPGMSLLTGSFMTDIPAAAASWASLLLGVSAIERRSRTRLIGCFLAGILAFTIREQLVVAVVAVTITAFVAAGVPKRFRLEAASGALLTAVLCIILEHLRHAMPNADVAPFSLGALDFSTIPTTLPRSLFTLALVTSPLAIWTLSSLRGRDWLQPGRIAGWIIALFAVWYVSGRNIDIISKIFRHEYVRVINGNYIQPWGAFGGNTAGVPPPIMGITVWNTLQLIAVGSAIVLVGEVGANLARPRVLWTKMRAPDCARCAVAVYAMLLIAFIVGLSFAGEKQVDRYMLALFPCAGLILLRPRQPAETVRTRAARFPLAVIGAGLVAFLVVIEASNTVSADVRDALEWRAASRLVASGIPAQAINAGVDWIGTHATTPRDRKGATKRVTYPGQHWANMFPKSTDCYVVTFSRSADPAWTLMSVASARPYGLHMNRIRVYSYHRINCSAAK